MRREDTKSKHDKGAWDNGGLLLGNRDVCASVACGCHKFMTISALDSVVVTERGVMSGEGLLVADFVWSESADTP